MTYRARALASDLGTVVRPASLTAAWKNSVREGLRSQVLPDLHDHLDLHRNIQTIAARISTDVAAGRYRPATPEFVTLEKKDGIARRMAIPDPKLSSRVLRGHRNYYGVPTNARALVTFRRQVERAWPRQLQRRSQRARWTVEETKRFEVRYPLPPARIVHPWPDRRFAGP
jgi:hypothetical protein